MYSIRPLPLAFDSAWFFLFGLMVLVAVARPVSQPRLTGLTLRLAAVGEILPAVERPDMRWIAVAVGPPDAELLFVRVDPSPQHVARHQPVGTRLALDAYDISGMPVPIAAMEAAAMIRAVARSPPAGRDGLPVIVAKAAGDAGHQAGGVERAQRAVERDPETPIHAADHVILGRHAGLLGRIGILPAEILNHEFRNRLGDDLDLAFALDRHLDLFRHADRIDLARTLVERPQITVDAGLGVDAFVDTVDLAAGGDARFDRSRRIPGCLVLLQRRTGDDQHYQADADGVAELAHEPAPSLTRSSKPNHDSSQAGRRWRRTRGPTRQRNQGKPWARRWAHGLAKRGRRKT